MIQAKAFVFDFDGVIMDSVPVKSKAFEYALRNFPKDQVAQLVAYHKSNGGQPRRIKFRHFFDSITKTSAEENTFKQLDKDFSDFTLKTLEQKKYLINETVQFIKKLHKAQLPIYISSAAKTEELLHLCKVHKINDYFVEIYGYPHKKGETLKKIAVENKINSREIIFVGDSISDKDASNFADTTFWGYNNLDLKNFGSRYIESFSSLIQTSFE